MKVTLGTLIEVGRYLGQKLVGPLTALGVLAAVIALFGGSIWLGVAYLCPALFPHISCHRYGPDVGLVALNLVLLLVALVSYLTDDFKVWRSKQLDTTGE